MIYGRNRTIHRTTHLDVVVDVEGNVIAVWFRCMRLPFKQTVKPRSELKKEEPPIRHELIAVEVVGGGWSEPLTWWQRVKKFFK